MSFQSIKGIAFDMDGVLLSSSPLHERAYGEALSGFAIQNFRYAAIAGMRTDEALRMVLRENGIPFSDEQILLLASRKSRIARALIREENPVMPGCLEVIGALSGVYTLALASSASPETVNVFLSCNNLRGRFSCVLHGHDVGRAKPAPDIYRLCFQRMGLPPEECLVIEDAVNGVQAAKSAGATVWALPTTTSVEELTAAGADRTIDSLTDLMVLAGGS